MNKPKTEVGQALREDAPDARKEIVKKNIDKLPASKPEHGIAMPVVGRGGGAHASVAPSSSVSTTNAPTTKKRKARAFTCPHPHCNRVFTSLAGLEYHLGGFALRCAPLPYVLCAMI